MEDRQTSQPPVVRHFEATLHNADGEAFKAVADVPRDPRWSDAEYKQHCIDEIAAAIETANAKGYR